MCNIPIKATYKILHRRCRSANNIVKIKTQLNRTNCDDVYIESDLDKFNNTLIDIVNKLFDDNNNVFNISVFVDLSNAFDTIDHTILLQKHNCYDIKGHIRSLFKSYLDNITPYISYKSVVSKLMTVKCGVP